MMSKRRQYGAAILAAFLFLWMLGTLLLPGPVYADDAEAEETEEEFVETEGPKAEDSEDAVSEPDDSDEDILIMEEEVTDEASIDESSTDAKAKAADSSEDGAQETPPAAGEKEEGPQPEENTGDPFHIYLKTTLNGSVRITFGEEQLVVGMDGIGAYRYQGESIEPLESEENGSYRILEIEPGSVLQVEATAMSGYQVDRLSCGEIAAEGGSRTASMEITAEADLCIEASFEEKTNGLSLMKKAPRMALLAAAAVTQGTFDAIAYWTGGDVIYGNGIYRDWYGDGTTIVGSSIFYDMKDSRISYCGNIGKIFRSTDDGRSMSSISNADAAKISGLEWVYDSTKALRVGYIIKYGYNNTRSAILDQYHNGETEYLWKYACTQLMVWGNAMGYWGTSHMTTARDHIISWVNGGSANAAAIRSYWNTLEQSVNNAMQTKTENPGYTTASILIFAGEGQQEQLKLELTASGSLKAAKSSSNTNITSGNAMYSLAGTVFGVYATKANATSDTNRVGTITVTASGGSNTITLEPGTWFYREVDVGPGYRLDTTVGSIAVASGATATITKTNEPLTAAPAMLTKSAADKSRITAGNAVFQLEYYQTSASDLSGTPNKVWIFQSKDGYIYFNQKAYYLSSWTSPEGTVYRSSSEPVASGSNYIYPIGRYRVREIGAPAGYTATDKMIYGTIARNSAKTAASFTWTTDEQSGILFYDTASSKTGAHLINAPIVITSEAVVAETGNHQMEENTSSTLQDTISYSHLRPATTYTVKTEFILIEDGKKTSLGEVSKSFTTAKNGTDSYGLVSGEVKTTLKVDSSVLPEKQQIAAIDRLYLGSTLLSTHNEACNLDAQMIQTPVFKRTSLTVKKIVTGNMGNKTDTFSIEVHASYKGEPVTGTFPAKDAEGNVLPDVTFTDGTTQLTLGHGDAVQIEGLRVGTTYKVIEEETDYVMTAENAEGELPDEGQVVIITNTRNGVIPTQVSNKAWMGLLFLLPLGLWMLVGRWILPLRS